MRVDCVTFFNEYELLALRISMLWDVIDRFVVVEATTTHSGRPKKCLKDARPDLVDRFKEKLIIHTITDLPKFPNRWIAEISQRNGISKALLEHGLLSDLSSVLISDVDELPNPQAIDAFAPSPSSVVVLEQSLHYYRLDLEASRKWRAAKIVGKEVLQHLSPQEVRTCYSTEVLSEAGWHFSYLSPISETANRMGEKLSSFAHSELASLSPCGWPKKLSGSLRRSHTGELLKPFSHKRLPPEVVRQIEGWRSFLEFPDGVGRTREITTSALASILMRTRLTSRWI